MDSTFYWALGRMSIQPAISPHLLRVNRVLGGSVNRRIFRAAAIVTFVGVLVKVVATAKEFVVAGIFGRSDAMDAFLIAFLVPGLLVNLFSESMNQALIPTLVRVREKEGHANAQACLRAPWPGFAPRSPVLRCSWR